MRRTHFNNDLLIDASGNIDRAYIARSAASRATYRYGPDYTDLDLAWWVEKLTGLAEILAEQWRTNHLGSGEVATQRTVNARTAGSNPAFPANNEAA